MTNPTPIPKAISKRFGITTVFSVALLLTLIGVEAKDDALVPNESKQGVVPAGVCPGTTVGDRGPTVGSLYSAIAIAAVLYSGLTMLRQRRTPTLPNDLGPRPTAEIGLFLVSPLTPTRLSEN